GIAEIKPPQLTNRSPRRLRARRAARAFAAGAARRPSSRADGTSARARAATATDGAAAAPRSRAAPAEASRAAPPARGGGPRAAELEIQRPRPGQRPAAEEGAAQIRRPAALATGDPLRRPGKRRVPRRKDARLAEERERVGVTRDAELVAGRPLEAALPVRPE